MILNDKILIWNCRGAASSKFFRNCKQYIDKHHPDMLIIIETRTHPSNLNHTFQKLGFDGFLFIANRGYAGGIVAAWKTHIVSTSEITNNFQFLHLRVSFNGGPSWYFTSIYASPDETLRRDL